MSPRSETYVGRTVMGPQYSEYYWRFLAKPIDAAWFEKLGQLSTAGIATLAAAANPTRLGNSTYLDKHFDLVNNPVAPGDLGALGAMTLTQLQQATPPSSPAPLLWLLARHAALRQYASDAYALLGSTVNDSDQLEPELIDISPTREDVHGVGSSQSPRRPGAAGPSAPISTSTRRMGRRRSSPSGRPSRVWRRCRPTISIRFSGRRLTSTRIASTPGTRHWRRRGSIPCGARAGTPRRCTSARMAGSTMCGRSRRPSRGATSTPHRSTTRLRPRSSAADTSRINRAEVRRRRSTCHRRACGSPRSFSMA